MTTSFRRVMLVILIILAAQSGGKTSFAQSNERRYFPETDHLVEGEFLRFYEKVPNSSVLYGYPITEAFKEEPSDMQVQYFQRARFELHPDHPAELHVQLTLLGALMYKLYGPGQIIPYPNDFPACKYFYETGFQVCHEFLNFFRANGGVAQFGYPISNFEFQDDLIVQYFQRARFEWHPEFSSGQKVMLTDLGARFYYQQYPNPPPLPTPDDYAPPPQVVLRLKTHAYLSQPITAFQSEQTVNVIVLDQNNKPVQNAAVRLAVRFPTGEQVQYTAPPTKPDGATQYTFSFSTRTTGVAEVRVTTAYDSLKQTTVTSFLIWW